MDKGVKFLPGMAIALEEARLAAASGEVPVGAALFCGKHLIAKAGNAMLASADPLAHAEMLVLREGAARLGRHGLADSVLYVSLEPCAMCAGAIMLARVKRLCYGASDPKFGAIEHNGRIFAQKGVNHQPEIYGGLAEKESALLLRAFFAHRR